MNPLSNGMYEQTRKQSKMLAVRMRSGTGVGRILGNQQATTHYIDALQRFKKDYAEYDRDLREQQKKKRQQQLQRKRLEQLERQNKRWEVVQQNYKIRQQKLERNFKQVQQGRKKTANSNGLAYNPINLAYDHNDQGQRLKLLDQDHKIRGYVRAYNMDHHGNSAYNPLNGKQRQGVSKIVPNELNNRYLERLNEFQQNRRLKVPQTSNQQRRNIFHYY